MNSDIFHNKIAFYHNELRDYFFSDYDGERGKEDFEQWLKELTPEELEEITGKSL